MAEREVVTETIKKETTPARTTREETVRQGRFSVDKAVYGILGIILTLLALRFLFLLLGANPDNGFVDALYRVSEPLVLPFYGIFNDADISAGYGSAHFESASVVAAVVYCLIGWIISYFVRPRAV
jgi:uncharacterized membrane protein